ncbi:MAG: hypothetical protein COB84_09200 [Rhodobacteraceae bacterium]|nr:MAG: hypothetical protein COB84_09200 [Paracoccaceae bacterium]
MKLTTLTIAIIFAASTAFAGQIGSGGVNAVKNNGNISGNPSWSIRCNSGSGVVIRKGNKWTNNTGSSYSERLWGLSLGSFAQKMCE